MNDALLLDGLELGYTETLCDEMLRTELFALLDGDDDLLGVNEGVVNCSSLSIYEYMGVLELLFVLMVEGDGNALGM